VALAGKSYQRIDGSQNIRSHLVGGGEIIVGDKIPNLAKINGGFRVEIVPGS
jgi:hypothetical protein